MEMFERVRGRWQINMARVVAKQLTAFALGVVGILVVGHRCL